MTRDTVLKFIWFLRAWDSDMVAEVTEGKPERNAGGRRDASVATLAT